ncbi:MAG: translational GTPase TypA [Chloroflexi bacterium]|nr:translational GTPase TypA [Chloroflexota bacterium]
MTIARTDIRNIAIIAHVDHGKTTLVDGLLRQARVFRENQQVAERVMDSNALERERGITILAKNTAILIPDPQTGQQVKINIVDTPGHADFGGEVERVLNMVDGVLLLVDAAEGPMPQTRFVLKKALARDHRVIVVINKVDRRGADPNDTLNRTFDLFLDLGASDDQAEFRTVYASAITGQAGDTATLSPDLQPLFEAILRYIPAPQVDPDGPLQMLVTSLGYDEHRGATAIGRVTSGKLRAGQELARIKRDGTIVFERARYLQVHEGLQRVDVDEVDAGDIAVVSGLSDVAIGETLADVDDPQALPIITVEEPTVRMTFGVNTSPLSGSEGRWGTSRRLRQRLFDELRHDMALRVVETDSPDTFEVSGRGELHLAILIENMRREGYEFQVSRPTVLFHRDENGALLEPFEEVHIETSSDAVGVVVEMLGSRRGQMLNMLDKGDGSVHLAYLVPTRGLLGFRYQFLTATRGLGVMNALFHDYLPYAGDIPARTSGSLIASEAGVTTSFGLKNAEERGMLFVTPGVAVYEGMVVGENSRPVDIAVNVVKRKHLTNMRQSTRDIEVRLNAPRQMSLDEAIEYLADDELLEVTPQSFRIRKATLDTHERGKERKRAMYDAELAS